MERLPGFLLCLLIAVWTLTAGVHYGTAFFLVAVSLVCAGFVTYKGWRMRCCRLPNEITPFDKTLAPFHGFGCFGWMLIVMIVLTALSIIPLPIGVLEVISPMAADWYREAWAIEGVERSWGFVSTSFGRTAFALWNLIGFFGVYLFALRLGATRNALLRLSHVFVVAGAVLLALWGLKSLGFPVSLGETGESAAWHIGLPRNDNHLSAVFVLLSLMSMGGFLTKRHTNSTARRGLWFVFYLAFAIAVVMLASRGAILSWIAGQVLLLIFFFGVSRQVRWKYGVVFLAAIGLVIMGVLYVSSSKLSSIQNEFAETEIRFETDDTLTKGPENLKENPISKTQMYGDFVHLVKDWGRAGIGRSAFRDVYPHYQSFPFRKHFRHAENEYWEILMDFGLFWGIVCLALWAVGVVVLCRTFWKTREERTIALGLLVGMMAVAIQNFFDFGIRYFSVGLPFWMICGVLEARHLRWKYGRIGQDHSPLDRKRKFEWCLGHGAIIVCLVVAVAVLPYAVDGQTQMSLHQLANCASKQGIEHCEDSIDQNLIRRSGSIELRRYVAQRLIQESARRNAQDRTAAWKEARRWLDSAMMKAPHDAWSALRLGKCCLALGDNKCAADHYFMAAQNDIRKAPDAMHEMAALPLDDIIMPDNISFLKWLVQSLIVQKREQDAMNLIQTIHQSYPDYYVSMMCLIYKHMKFEEGCDVVMETLPEQMLTLDIFELRIDKLARSGQYESLFAFLDSSESVLKDSFLYWQKRLYLTAFSGKKMGDEWYQEQVPRVLSKIRQRIDLNQKLQFDLDVCEAQFALEQGQYARARVLAERALKKRPKHTTANKILQAALNGK